MRSAQEIAVEAMSTTSQLRLRRLYDEAFGEPFSEGPYRLSELVGPGLSLELLLVRRQRALMEGDDERHGSR